ncbi:MAG: phenylalanyl-tRNA synthetase alpha chain, partial [Actinomycetota bacterium]|nr:phenylalanyl-tRNA synthetase alpha chain [Actinomycetota bacterium]
MSDPQARAAAATTLADLDALETELLGKRSELTTRKQQLGTLPPEERKEAGRRLNEERVAIERALADRRVQLEEIERRVRIDAERLDLTELQPVRRRGHLHLVTHAIDDLVDTFVGMGFTVAEGPEVEDDWHNFTALNFGEHHPARDMQDTFFVDLGRPREVLLRTHT